jgi:hypothetical protein
MSDNICKVPCKFFLRFQGCLLENRTNFQRLKDIVCPLFSFMQRESAAMEPIAGSRTVEWWIPLLVFPKATAVV